MVATQAIAPGTMFGGDFRVIRPLGAGGMGAVYVAEQLSTGNQRALKLMDPQLLRDAELRERFTNEARVGARIDSDHVVQVVAAGVDAGSETPWLVMELLQGENLGQNVRRCGRLHPAKVAEVVSQLCHALAAAHRVGIVHRDLKPENVFLAAPRREGVPFTVKVLDFGIAKVLQGATSHMTASLGTPLWMAPEQTSPGVDVGPATDIWAVGLLVFWMLCGQSYWRAARVQPPSLPSLIREVVLDPIEPPSARAAEIGLPGLFTPAMDAWLVSCLQREPSQRFPDATKCRDALLRALPAGAPYHSSGPPNAPSGTVPVGAIHPSPAASTMPARDGSLPASPSAGAAVPGITPAPTPPAATPPPAPRKSYLPHISILTCGTIVLAMLGSCVSVVLYGSYKADKIAMPDIRRHHVVGFEAKRFDPTGFLPVATDLAREHDPSAKLVQVDVTGVGAGETIDLSRERDGRHRSVVYSYRADRAHRDYCSVNVIVDANGVTSTQAKTAFCSWPPLQEPTCSISEVRDKAVEKGAPKADELSFAYRVFDGGQPTWAASGDRFSTMIADDCK